MRYNTPYIKDGLSNTLLFDIRCRWRNDRVDIIAPSRMNDSFERAHFFRVFRRNATHTASSCRCESRFAYFTVRTPYSEYILNILLHKPSRLRGRDLLVSKLRKNWQRFMGNCFLARARVCVCVRETCHCSENYAGLFLQRAHNLDVHPSVKVKSCD